MISSRYKPTTVFLISSACLSFILCIASAAYYTYHYEQSVEFQNYHRYYQLILANRPPTHHMAPNNRHNIFVHGMPPAANDTQLSQPHHSPHQTTLVSFNIRFNAPWISRVVGERAWHVRKYGVLDILLKLPADAIIGIQEAKLEPLASITFPNTYFSYFGVGRDDGAAAGEYAPILFNQRFWRLLDADYKWLSHTPEVPSIYPGTGHKRIATMCKLENVILGKQIIVLNTHLDHQVAAAREYSVSMLHEWMNELLNQTQPARKGAEETVPVPVFLMGDFNLMASDVAYKNLTASDDITDLNLKQKADPTYVGFNSKSHKSVIDFIFARSFDADKWRNYSVLDNVFHGITISDHRPISVALAL